MNEENEMNTELKQLLDALEQHGKNARRQKRLGTLIDQLAAEEKTVEMPRKRNLTPIWWAMGAAAACLLLWLLVKPSEKQQPEMENEFLVEETKTIDSIKMEANDVVFEKPLANEAFLAEKTPVVPQHNPTKKEKPKSEILEIVVEQPVLAEIKPMDPQDNTTIESNTIPTTSEMPSAAQKPQRRVIRSLNLVCYECQKDPEFEIKPVLESKTLFGQPQDPNMKNGSLALELKLN
ncbi:MAG: hypothetical protein IJ622_08455 [Bacteroidales bacterium]|nr:hypothetical protein [Bacteroidales bacterium]